MSPANKYRIEETELEAVLTGTFGPPPASDIEAWHNRYPAAMGWLDPGRYRAAAMRRRRERRILTVAAATAVAACVWLGIDFPRSIFRGHSGSAIAETVAQIQRAKTMTWTTHFYEHVTSKDGKSTWFDTEIWEQAFKAPGFTRQVKFDDKGRVTQVEITDQIHGRGLTYYPPQKKATLREITPMASYGPPFGCGYYAKRLEAQDLQWIAKRKTPSGDVNIFRDAFRDQDNQRDWSVDFWIDAKTKQLVAVYQPGADIYDPENDPARGVPVGKGRSTWNVMGGGHTDIRYDVPLDDSLFSLQPPAGYTVEHQVAPHLTEHDTLEYLRIFAQFNDGTFPDKAFPHQNLVKLNAALKKPSQQLSPIEKKYIDLFQHYFARNIMPLGFFLGPDLVENSFRYLGKGVKLGQKDRIVCWYKLKAAKDPSMYRVVYGDLSVKDVPAKDLPLPVGGRD